MILTKLFSFTLTVSHDDKSKFSRDFRIDSRIHGRTNLQKFRVASDCQFIFG